MNPYLRLMRLHQPTGIFLLLWPCWWGIALAGGFDLRLMVLFTVGAVVMRGAGCIVNDLWDRDFDRQVERTKMRPLASGELNVKQALVLLFGLLVVALLIALSLPLIDFWLAVFSLLLVGVYPLMKRVTWWPQAFLGLTFNWGALMGYAAVRGALEWPAVFLYSAGVFWTLAYDTIYAHQDARDDIAAGVKSTALWLGARTKPALGVFFGLMLASLMLAGALRGLPALFYILLALPAGHMGWQVVFVNINDPADCLQKFKANAFLGGFIWVTFALVHL